MASSDRLRALVDLSRTLASSFELDEVLRRFTTHATAVTGASATAVSLWDRERDLLVTLTDYQNRVTAETIGLLAASGTLWLLHTQLHVGPEKIALWFSVATLVSTVYIMTLLPEFLVLKYNVPFYFGGTSLLIIVVVTMDFWAQVQSYVMSQQYESLLKKANFKTS